MILNVLIDKNRPVSNTTIVREYTSQVPAIRDVVHWHAVEDSQSVVRSINLSHKRIIEDARRKKAPETLIVEEDVMFTHPDAMRYFLANKPESFDLYLGGCYGLNWHCKERIRGAGPGAHEINNFTGLHCYIIHEKYYNRFLAMPDNKHIDDQPGMGMFYVCYPFIALQHPGWSANNRMEVNYNHDMTKDFLYNGNTEETSC